MISKPVLSKELWLGPVGVPEAELVLPEYLKGKLSLDEWRLLIAMHLLRLKAYSSGRRSGIFGLMLLGLAGVFFALLILFLVFVGRPWASVLVWPAWSPALLIFLLWWSRKSRGWEFEQDREVANMFNTEAVTLVLEKMRFLDPRANASTRLARFQAYWIPSIDDRIAELRKPMPLMPPRSSRIHKVGLRWRAMIVGIGFAIYWGSGFIAGLVYSQGRASFAYASNGCAALVMSAALGYWLAILAGISLVIGVLQHIRGARWKKKRLEER